MPYPVGQVLTQPYPLADLSQVQVTVDNLPAVVQFAGMTFAGVFQVNIQVPQTRARRRPARGTDNRRAIDAGERFHEFPKVITPRATTVSVASES